MKKIVYITLLFIIPAGLYGQQFPFMEGYNMNPFNMSPSFAGLKNSKALFMDYRADWVGLKGGPVTYQLSYNDRILKKVGIGGRYIYDKTDIFKQTILLGTYTYEVKIFNEHFLNFALSAGLFRNSIDLEKYYDDPDYSYDIVLIYGSQKSNIKFATDVSFLYRFREFEGGLLFSNVMFGSAKYNSSDIAYKPMKNFLIHTSFNFNFADDWSAKPFVLLRGGQHYPAQLELASEVAYIEKYWVMAVYRSGGVWGVGIGGEIYKGVLLNYSYNLSSNVALNAFGSHQITLGVKIFELLKINTLSK